jgi:tetratricopeptide (TPR) repeat protein
VQYVLAFALSLPFSLPAQQGVDTGSPDTIAVDQLSREIKTEVHQDAGLWTTPKDLAKVAIEIALSKRGKANHVLSQKMVSEMLSVQTPDNGNDPTVGLAFFLNKNNPGEFGHGGADEGFQAVLTMLADSGDGITMMGNSDAFFGVAPYVVETVARGYGWRYTPDTRSSGEVLGLVARAKGTEAALEFYREMKQGSEHRLNEADLNFLGYQLMQLKRTDDAIRVFQLNVQEYPNAWNPYDSLAEAYMNAGQKDLAIQNYEKSLALNPNNKNGAEKLKKLKGAD